MIKIPCLGHRVDYGADGWDYDCDYKFGDIDCEDCICKGGDINPKTGRKLNRLKERLETNYKKEE